jgi:ubiquinone biosynthesis protein UbiJ
MSRQYLTPFPRLFASAIELVLNRSLRFDPQSKASMTGLSERVLAIGLEGLGIDLYFSTQDEQFQVRLHSEQEADTWIRGTPTALAGMGLGSSGRPGAVQIQGDAELARSYQQFFEQLNPDWEEAIAQRFGDVIGHRLSSAIKGLRQWLLQARADTAAMTGDYLREESGLLITAVELDDFLEAVDEIRDDTERLAARIAQLQQ